MGEEKKDEGVGDPIKMLLEEALEKQRNAMMDNFAQILQRMPTGAHLHPTATLEAPLLLRYK
jgi:hypothetical protein